MRQLEGTKEENNTQVRTQSVICNNRQKAMLRKNGDFPPVY